MATLNLADGEGEGDAGAGEAVGGSGGVKEREDAEMRMLGGRADGQPSLVDGVVGLERHSFFGHTPSARTTPFLERREYSSIHDTM